ncbi:MULTISPECIES: hypothetical protein [Limnospira]|uniref:Uncharacterized protein n=3 Tax=Limnospira TaxID=2596745 RepID=B5W9M2_LIMMA|nr:MULTISPECIES: hypothetical protein [Limnospira]EKD10225.1 hypothetical protein SPLC1_S102550 [Arthrospira platensis C1]MDC0836369.1 hypothetical protein [Limnoraphis robusta]MDY7054210.1 hypothetical protein [Limnospira fusiformis LS22]EDZ91768.1 hypothetical protein AmaxDRAFT_5472 [Limnospira maxima CS-328]QNH58058.1 MAG: hypothetical protein H2674_01245 [Limnospira indica BM01]
MSKKSKNRKHYYLNNPGNQDILLLRDEVHKALTNEQFIVEIPVRDDEIIEIEENKNKNYSNNRLVSIKIDQLDYHNDKSTVEKIWKVDLEKPIPGISTQSKTPECAILVLQKYQDTTQNLIDEKIYRLMIILIELKSSINVKNYHDSVLKNIEGKFADGMSRMYILLTLNNHLNPIQGYHQETIYIDFQGILFYLKSNLIDNNSQLYSILNNQTDLLTCRTLLREQDKIKIKHLKVTNQMTISLETLLSK